MKEETVLRKEKEAVCCYVYVYAQLLVDILGIDHTNVQVYSPVCVCDVYIHTYGCVWARAIIQCTAKSKVVGPNTCIGL